MTTTKLVRVRRRRAVEAQPAVDEADPWVRACRALERGDEGEVQRLMSKQNDRAVLVYRAKRRARGKREP